MKLLKFTKNAIIFAPRVIANAVRPDTDRDYLVMARREHFKNEVAHIAGCGNCEWQDQVDHLNDERNQRILAEANA